MVVILPSMQLLRDHFPSSRLALLTNRVGEEFYNPLSIFDEIIDCSDKNETAKYQFSVALIHYSHNAPALPLFKKNIALRISYDRDVGFSRRIFYDLADIIVSKDFDKNEIDNSRKMLRAIGITDNPHPYKLKVPPDADKKIAELLAKSGAQSDNLVIFQLESEIPYKLWSNNNWIELAKLIEAAGDFQIIILNYSAPMAIFQHLIKKHSLRAKSIKPAGIWQLAALINHASALVTLDSGPKHIAFALGTPTITLYGRSDERRWGAYWDKRKHIALRSCTRDLSYEEMLGLPQNHQTLCITPQQVFHAFQQITK
jgi:ADP-heptose:LPS heptosyltransferase